MYLLTYDGDGRKKKYCRGILLPTWFDVEEWIREQCKIYGLTVAYADQTWVKFRLPDADAANLSWRWDGSIYYRIREVEVGIPFPI
jgi:hypothetical protein